MMMNHIDLEIALARRNPHPGALGNIKRVRLFGMTFYLSPDLCVWLVPTGITVGLAIGALAMTRDVSPLWEKVGCLGLALIAFIASLTVGMTDPGIYPRLSPIETDPLEGAGHGFTLCRACNIRRPPRAAHCYVCNVCVLEHDHHCGVIGGCVGQRSLRWFTLYLVCISSAATWGLFWLAMDVTGYRPHPEVLDIQALTTVTHDGDAPITNGRPNRGGSRYKRKAEHSAESINTAIDIMLMVFLVNIVLVVGGLALYYVYLLCKDTTRREAQGKFTRPSGPGMGVVATLKRTMFPPPSMLEMPSVDMGLGTSSRNQGGIV